METILFPAAVAVVVFIAILLIWSHQISNDADRRKKSLLGQVKRETQQNMLSQMDEISLLKDEASPVPTSGMFGLLFKFPGVQTMYDLLLKAGYERKRGTFLAIMGAFLLVMLSVTHMMHMGGWGLLISLGLTYYAPYKYLQNVVAKRNRQFLNLFPDAIDMIVRSVRSGHPLNIALRMIAENMDSPLSDEFKQVIDEVSYGRTLPEALLRLSRRIGEQDLHFFVVVLSVQQETGGSLAEVLTNLSGIIRKRRQLRLKIHALTSEGRSTSYILGGLPVLEFCILYWISPGYMDPLFATLTGQCILAFAVFLIVAAMYVVRIMINIDI